ncbi:MAG: calcium/sodium antiporter, partial [ANME-2 cluster archaeon]|nr:calcium/sodium antiporter [ANME-2 cluster archaeon]
SVKHESDIVIGNIVGSNIANIGLIIGLATVLTLIRTREEMLKRDGYIMLFAACLFYIFIIDGNLSRMEAVLFLISYAGYIRFLFMDKPKYKDRYGFKEFVTTFFHFELIKAQVNKRKKQRTDQREKISIFVDTIFLKDVLVLVISAGSVILGANYLVVEAIFFADLLHIPKMVVGLTLVAVGTSLPELSVSISAARNGYGDIAVANIIGSNIANIFLILGLSALVYPLSVEKSILFYFGPFMIFLTVLLLIFIRSHWELRRKEGIAFLFLYLIFILFLFHEI